MPAALRRLVVVAALALTWLLSAASGQAQTPPPPDPTAYMTYLPLVVQALAPPAAPNPVVVAQVGGEFYNDLAYANGYLYLVTDDRLQIHDLSDPAQPRLVGQTPALGRNIYALAVDGPYAYLGDSRVGLIVVDIHAPANPFLVATLDLPTWMGDLAVRDNIVYVSGIGLTIVDVSNRAAPIIIGRYTNDDPDRPLGNGAGIALAGRYAYIANDNEGALWIIDIGDPTRPTLVSNRGGSSDGVAVALYDHYALVAYDDAGIGVYDVSDPMEILRVGAIRASRSRDMFVVNGLAYVSVYQSGPTGGWGVAVYDIQNVANPTQLTWLPFDTDAIFATDRLAFLALGTGGALVYDVSAPQTPRPLSVVGQPTYARCVAVDGPRAYVSDWNLGLFIYDISNPARPIQTGQLPLRPTPVEARISASVGLVALFYQEELLLVDARDSARPRVAARWTTPDRVSNVYFVSPTLLAVAAGQLYLFDVSEPTAPRAVGQLSVQGYPGWLAGGLPWLLMAGVYDDGDPPSEEDRLWVVDLSTPSAPRVAGEVALPRGPFFNPLAALTQRGDYAYIMHVRSGLTVVDVSYPAAPLAVSALPEMLRVWDMTTAGDILLGLGEEGLALVSIRSPLTPRLLGWSPLPGGRQCIAAQGDHVFIAGAEAGLLVLKLR